MAKINAYSLVQSFSANGKGRKTRRIIDCNSKTILDARIWSAGALAFKLILDALNETNSEVTPKDVLDSMEDLGRQANDYLCQDHFPAFMKIADERNFQFNTDAGKVLSNSQVISYWKDYDLPSRILIFLKMTAVDPMLVRESPEYGDFVRHLAAVAVLFRIDDAAKAEIFDGRGLSECVADIEQIRPYLEPPAALFHAVDVAVKSALSEKSKKGGLAKYQKSNDARAFVVSEWGIHREAYNNNKSAFSRDYVRRLSFEFSVTVTEKTIREVWLVNTPSASKQAGQLAAG